MKYLYMVLLLTCSAFAGFAQSDTTEIRKPPVLSDLPIIYDRNELSSEMAAMKKPVLQPMPVTVTESTLETPLGTQPALRLYIPEVDMDLMKRIWGRYLRKDGDGRLQREGNSLFMEDVQMEEVTSEYFNAAMRFEQDSSGTLVEIAMATDSTVWTPESHAGTFEAMESVLRKRGLEAYQEKVEDDLNEERNNLEDMERDLKNLVKDSEKSHKTISDNNIAINQTNIEIDQNEIELRAISQELVQKRSAVSAARDKENRKAAKKAENATEKAQKKLQKQREKMFESIIDAKRDIAESEQSIKKNLGEQRALLLKMHQQTLLIEALKDKLAAIK